MYNANKPDLKASRVKAAAAMASNKSGFHWKSKSLHHSGTIEACSYH